MHPQPGTTFSMTRVSVPVDLSQNMCDSSQFCGANPKSKNDSGIVKFGSANTDEATSPRVARALKMRLYWFILLRLSTVRGVSSSENFRPPQRRPEL